MLRTNQNTQNSIHDALLNKKKLEDKLKLELNNTLKFVLKLTATLFETLSEADRIALEDMIERLKFLNLPSVSLNMTEHNCKRINECLIAGNHQQALNGKLSRDTIPTTDFQTLQNHITQCLSLTDELKKNAKHIEVQQEIWLKNQNKPEVKNPAPLPPPKPPVLEPAVKDTQHKTVAASSPSTTNSSSNKRRSSLVPFAILGVYAFIAAALLLSGCFPAVIAGAALLTGLSQIAVIGAASLILFGGLIAASAGSATVYHSSRPSIPLRPYNITPVCSTLRIASAFDTKPFIAPPPIMIRKPMLPIFTTPSYYPYRMMPKTPCALPIVSGCHLRMRF